ncbi:MAG: hypothetical protein K2V38_13345, partial [Gemmataceae bacterium]|nr:hypothetical protein [Gemmataceae bacterium]
RVGRGPQAAVAFSPDGKLVAVGSLALVRVFDVDSGAEAFKVDRASDGGLAHHIAFSPDGRLLVFGTTGTAGGVEVWELATRTQVRRFATGYGETTRLGVLPGGDRFASAGGEETVTVWELTPAQAKAPSKNELRAAWDALDAPDGAVGFPAAKRLGSAGAGGAEVLAEGVKELLAAQKKINGWVEDLGSASFTVREVAAKELVSQGARALPAVTAASKGDNPDRRDHALEVLRKLEAKNIEVPEHGLTSDTLRLVRAVQSLEDIGTTSAKELLGQIAATAPGRASDEAKAALARMGK